MTETIAKIIAETLTSGIEPLHRKYVGIYDGYGDVPTAYLTETEIFTTASGVVKEYRDAIEKNETGKRFSLSCVENAVRALNKLKKKDRRVTFVTAEVTESFLSEGVKELEKVLEQGVNPSEICLTFSEKALIDGGEKVAEGIADARGMGFLTAISSFNGEESLSALMKVTVDYAFLSPTVTALSSDRNKRGVFTALTGLLNPLRISAVLCGVKDDDTIRSATATECFGVIPSDEYSGQFAYKKGGRELQDILSDGDETL